MAAFRSRICFRSCLSALWSSAWPRVGWRASRCRSMAASSWRTRATTVVSPANSSRRPQVNYGARKYLEELEQENGDGEPIHQQDKVSTTDPDSTYLTKGNRAA